VQLGTKALYTADVFMPTRANLTHYTPIQYDGLQTRIVAEIVGLSEGKVTE